MNNLRIAVLMTCHNRKEKTLKCLESLFKQKSIDKFSIKVFLVDDGSSDGTGDAVIKTYPDVYLLHGNGDLFWNGGMRLAFSKAIEEKYDFYLWLNDDTYIYEDALSRTLDTYFKLLNDGYDKNILVGSAFDPDTKEFTYGGAVRSSFWHPLKFRLIKPSPEEIISCDTMCGNFVLLPSKVVNIVGNLDENFKHAIGDYDYGLRAGKKSCKIWVVPGYVGTCSKNPPNVFVSNDSLYKKLKIVKTEKGLPMNQWKVYARRHGGIFWFLYWLMPYCRLILTSIFRNTQKSLLSK